MGYTIAEKIIMHHIGHVSVRPGDLVTVEPDFVACHDIYTESIERQFRNMGLVKVWNSEKIAVIHDHLNPCCLENDPINLEAGYRLVKQLGIKHFHATGGICHRLIPEKGYAKPGQIVFVTDSHTPTYGGLGCFATGVGHTEMAAIWGTGKMWMRVPATVKITINGNMNPNVSGKDIILQVIKDLTASGGTYKALEFGGTAIHNLSIEDRMTIANMAVECGAKTALFPVDEKTCEFCHVNMEEVIWINPDQDAVYEKELTYEAQDLEPMIACHPAVDNVKPVREMMDMHVDQVFLGSCTNGSLEDLRIAADIMQGSHVADHVKFIVTPATNQVMEGAITEGYIQTFVAAGGIVTPPYCSFCEGRSMALLDDDEVCLGTNNRNFLGRNGSKKAKVYLASPAVAAMTAIAGRIACP